MGNKAIFWGQPNKNNVVRPGEFIVPPKKGAPGAAFDALTYDPVNFEMRGVKTGTGDLSAVSSSTHYAPDHEGIFQQFAPNTPVWYGARCVLTGGPGSLVDKAYADDGTGTLLPDLPYLQYYPAAENSVVQSNHFDTGWDNTNVNVSQTLTGLTGEANTGAILTATTGNFDNLLSPYFATTSGPPVTVGIRFEKSSSTSTESLLLFDSPPYGIFINPQTGAFIGETGTGEYEIIDYGNWVKLLLYKPSLADASPNVTIYPDRTGAGSLGIGVLQVEMHVGKTLDEVRGLDPIFTTTAAVATTETVYDNDIANHDDNAAYYAEIVLTDADHTTNHIEVDTPTSGNIFGTGVGGLLVTTDNIGSINVSGSVIDTPHKVGVVHTTGGQKAINLNGVWSIDTGAGSWTTALNSLRYGGGSDYSFKIRNVQRYDGTDFDELKAIIDGLMV